MRGREFNYAQDGGVARLFDTMLIVDLSALPKLSCSTDQTCKCLGSQLWAFLSSVESKKAITVSQSQLDKSILAKSTSQIASHRHAYPVHTFIDERYFL